MRARTLFLALVFLILPAAASANGRFPAANQLVVAPSNASELLLRTTFGVLLSKDGGKTWDWMCEKSVGYGGTEDPSLGITAGGTFLAGTFEGLTTSADTGCSWAPVPGKLTQNVVVDLVVRPDTPGTALVMTNKFFGADDAGSSLFTSEIFLSTDDGKTWNSPHPPLDPTVIFETIEVAKSDPLRVYASGTRGAAPDTKGVLFVSTDGGATWTERPVPLDTQADAGGTERAPFVSAVDPTNADRVYLRTKGAGPSRLLVTDDAGKTFREAFKMSADMLGFALSPDGKKVFIGGAKDGLWGASTADLKFTKKTKIAIQCLTATATTLYACSNELGGFILGASNDDGASFAPLLHLYGVRGPIDCPAASGEGRLCVADWPILRDSLGSPPDAGADAESDAGPPSGSSGTSGGCKCDATPSSGGGALALLLGVGLLGLLKARRPRARR